MSTKAKKIVYHEIARGTFPISSFCDVTLIFKKFLTNMSNEYSDTGNY